jgi:hypothetical protein
VLAANQQPHPTIAKFRAPHETAIVGLFGLFLAVCARAGLLRPRLVDIAVRRPLSSKGSSRRSRPFSNATTRMCSPAART